MRKREIFTIFFKFPDFAKFKLFFYKKSDFFFKRNRFLIKKKWFLNSLSEIKIII